MHDTQEYKVRLETMLEGLKTELATIGIHDPTNPQNWIAIPEGVDANEPDSDMVADVIEDWDERRATLGVLEMDYNNVIRALKKIDAGSFGTCEVCGGPIESERLDADPAARTDKTHLNEEGTLSL